MSERITSAFHARSTALEVVEQIDLHGQRAIVTGGASGLGWQTTRALAHAGAAVTMAVRNPSRGEAAADALRREVAGAQVTVAALDLTDLASIHRFAADWARVPLHILINNAALMACPLMRTPQGWEAQFATNHLGHFALMTALIPALLAAQTSRVVTLSSSGHKLSGVDFADVHFARRPYDKWQAYGQAKSANALMSLGLHTLLCDDGITSNAVHPGAIMTGLQQFLPTEEMRALGWLKADGTPIDLFKTREQGAATTVWAATAEALEGVGGLYLEDCTQGLPAEPANRLSGYSAHVMDVRAALRLWDVSAELLKSG
jgi:NAD(P)-dependent dehydrogenase (short-subunit alcohol dehydrogenase family)